ncbi:hypothetical protein F4780DRAFT_63996 [Xylariomycetidae sp. FL0641]|nr:hypothetical protein F4780DRAFT_63996 [Xylariomycetidae sp. FL0641]
MQSRHVVDDGTNRGVVTTGTANQEPHLKSKMARSPLGCRQDCSTGPLGRQAVSVSAESSAGWRSEVKLHIAWGGILGPGPGLAWQASRRAGRLAGRLAGSWLAGKLYRRAGLTQDWSRQLRYIQEDMVCGPHRCEASRLGRVLCCHLREDVENPEPKMPVLARDQVSHQVLGRLAASLGRPRRERWPGRPAPTSQAAAAREALHGRNRRSLRTSVFF